MGRTEITIAYMRTEVPPLPYSPLSQVNPASTSTITQPTKLPFAVHSTNFKPIPERLSMFEISFMMESTTTTNKNTTSTSSCTTSNPIANITDANTTTTKADIEQILHSTISTLVTTRTRLLSCLESPTATTITEQRRRSQDANDDNPPGINQDLATNTALLRAVIRQAPSLAATMASLPASARTAALELMITAPGAYRRDGEAWRKHVVEFYGHGHGRSDHDNGAWCALEQRWLPAQDVAAAEVVEAASVPGWWAATALGEDGAEDAGDVLADVRNALPLGRRVAQAWQARAFVLMPCVVDGEWTYQAVVPKGWGRGRVPMRKKSWKGLHGTVLRFRNGCRPRPELMYLRFVMDVVELRREEMAVVGEGRVKRCDRSLAGCYARAWRGPGLLRRDVVEELCASVGDSELVELFHTLEERDLRREKDLSRGVDGDGSDTEDEK